MIRGTVPAPARAVAGPARPGPWGGTEGRHWAVLLTRRTAGSAGSRLTRRPGGEAATATWAIGLDYDSEASNFRVKLNVAALGPCINHGGRDCIMTCTMFGHHASRRRSRHRCFGLASNGTG
jgi:hypothetical protein